MAFKKIAPQEIEGNVFEMIGDRWMLITAGDKGKYNTMTASWGGLGILWKLPVATCYIRPQRYTREFVEQSDYFTLTVFPKGRYKAELDLCGSKSGRDVDKAAACGFTPEFSDCGAPYFAEAELVLVCKKLYYDDFEPGRFLDDRIEKNYGSGDYHRMYVGEIVEVLKAE